MQNRSWTVVVSILMATAGPAAAATTALLNSADDGHVTIVMFQNGSSDDALLSFSCTPGKNTFGVSMAIPGHETWPVDGATVDVAATAEKPRSQHFSPYGKYLVWGGDQARTTFQHAIASGTVTIAVSGVAATFAFNDVKPQIARYSELCGLQ